VPATATPSATGAASGPARDRPPATTAATTGARAGATARATASATTGGVDVVGVTLALAATTARRAARVLVLSALHAPTSSGTASR